MSFNYIWNIRVNQIINHLHDQFRCSSHMGPLQPWRIYAAASGCYNHKVIQAERGYYYSLTPWEHLALLNLKSGIKLYQLHF